MRRQGDHTPAGLALRAQLEYRPLARQADGRRAHLQYAGLKVHGLSAYAEYLADPHPRTVEELQQVRDVELGGPLVDKGAPLVARLFSVARSYAAAEADLAVLRYLAEIGFPSERPFGDDALTSHEGQALLVTGFVRQVAKAKRPPYPIVNLGATVGRLHGLTVPAGADRPAGALHHFAEGTMTDELRTVAGWLDSIEARVPSGAGDAFDALRTAVSTADGGDGLPEALVHPDPVPKNVIFTADGPVLVDWTSAGRGPRLASMTLVLRSGWAAAPFLKGYSRMVHLTDEAKNRSTFSAGISK